MADYSLPDLPYDYAALEPHVSAQIMELHHDKHHAAYVTGANQTLEKLAAARDKDDFGAIVGLEKTLAFHVSGHVLHSIFWKNQSPDGGDKPDGALGSAIDENFGSFDKFKAHFTQATSTIQGSGWGVLAYEPLAGRLIVEQVYDHQGNVGNGSVPLLVFDAWEHAFYLQYKNVKADFFAALWNVVNWPDVAARLDAAKALTIPGRAGPVRRDPSATRATGAARTCDGPGRPRGRHRGSVRHRPHTTRRSVAQAPQGPVHPVEDGRGPGQLGLVALLHVWQGSARARRARCAVGCDPPEPV